MKYTKILGLASLVLLVATSCRQGNQYKDVVKRTYIHEYGVPVAKADWDEQGKDGKIIQLKKNGVTLSQSFSKGILNGESTYTFPNSSTVHRVETFEHGELTAKREHYPSGVPMYEEMYQLGSLVRKMRWYEDGSPAASETYHNHYLVSGEYRTPLNVVESFVKEGEGTRICRSSNGELVSKDTIKNGELNERITYFTNGDPQTITPYEKEKIHGLRLVYLQGGLPSRSEEWIHGLQEGITTVYLNGEKYAEIPYVRGKKRGVENRYRDGKTLVEKVTWKDNIVHGERILYIDGETKVEWYHQGEMVSRPTFERMNLPR